MGGKAMGGVRRLKALAVGMSTVLLTAAVGSSIALLPARASNVPLTIAVTPSANPVSSGAELTWTIDAANTGGARVDGVVLTDQINGLTGLILTSSVGSCSQSANQVVCNAGTLTGGQTWEVTVRGVVNAPNATVLNNTATITGNKSSTTFTQSVQTSSLVTNNVTGPLADLTVAVSAPSQVAPGGTFTYNLTVNNIGQANATGVSVVDTLPAGFSVVAASGSDPQPIRSTSLFACSGATVVTCSGGAVNAGANATISIDTVAASGPAATYQDTAVVDPYDAIPENNDLNNTGSASTTTKAPAPQTGLSISVQDLKDPIRPGDLETYQIHVANISNNRADSIAVVDGTQGLDAASIKATSTLGTCTVNAPKVTCTQVSPVLRLSPGQTMDVTITGTVVASAGSLLLDTATVNGNISNKAVSSSAATTTSVRPGVDLTVTLRAEVATSTVNPTFRAWDNFNYVLNVGNSGLNDASNVLVRLPLPAGVVFQSTIAGSSGVICGADANQVVTCTLNVAGATSSAQPGGTVSEFRINVVAPPSTGTITATATVDPNNSIFESDETNNTFTVATPILTGIDLTVTKTSPPVVAPSGTLVYTIVGSNIGTQDASGVVIRDSLPAGTRFRSVSTTPPGDHNFTCSGDGGTPATVQCVGGNLRGTHNQTLPVDQVTMTVVTFAPAAPGLITNQVRIDPDNAIQEISETNNINTWNTDIEIGGCCVYNDFIISKAQVSPVDGSGNPVAVAPSGLVDYEITVTNTGSDPAFNVALQDNLPQSSTFRYATDENPGSGAFTCSPASGGVVNCTGATFDGSTQAPNTNQTRKVKVGIFAPTQPGSYTDQAIIDPNNTIPEANETNNTAQVTTQVALGGGGSYIDLAVDSTQSKPASAVVPNGMLEYTLTPKNLGTAAAFNVELQDTLPAGTVFRSAVDTTGIPSGAFTCSASAGVVDCTGGTLDGSNNDTPAIGDTTRTVVIDVFAPGHPGGYVNQANIDPKNAIAENDETNNTSQVTTTVSLSGGGNYVDLDIQSLTPSIAEPSPGAQVTYTAIVENTGTDMVNNVEFKDVLPAGITYVNASGTQGFLCSQSSGVVDCTGGTLDGSLDQDPANGTTATVTILVQAPPVADQSFTDQATIDPGNAIPEANEGNNSASTDIHVKAHVDLTTTISGSGSSGSTGTWNWTAAASGTDGATNVTVVANLPVGVIIENINAPTGWSCTTAENPVNQVTCVGNLAAGGTASFSADIFVTAQSGTALDSSSVVDPNNTVVESDETNNTAQSTGTA